MPDQPIKYNSQLEKDEHDDSANIGGKRVILFGWNSSSLAYERLSSTNGILNVAGGGGSSTTVTYNSTPPTLTNTQTAPLQGTSNGDLKVFVDNNATGGLMGRVNIYDTNNSQGVAIKAASTAAVAADPSMVVSISPNNNVPSSDETSTIFNGPTALTPLFATIAAGSNGDNTVIAAVGGKRIRVIAGLLLASGAVNVFFRDAAAGTAVTGTMNLATNSGFAIPYVPVGNFQTSVGNALVLNLSAGTAVGGWLTYVTV